MNAQSTVILRDGNLMPVIGLGTWQLTYDTAKTIEQALALGYRMIDTSSDYGTQPDIGEALRRSGIEREKVFIVTKVEEIGNSYEATRANNDELQTAYSDLVLIHRPPPTGAGEDLWQGLIRAKQEGIAKNIGVSNYSIELIQELADATGEMPVVNQIEWTPFGHDNEMLEYCRAQGIVIQAYSPLTRTIQLDNEILQRIASSYGKTPAQVLIRWNIQLGVVPIPKANRFEHLQENLDVFDFELNNEEMMALSNLNEHYSSLKGLPYL